MNLISSLDGWIDSYAPIKTYSLIVNKLYHWDITHYNYMDDEVERKEIGNWAGMGPLLLSRVDRDTLAACAVEGIL